MQASFHRSDRPWNRLRRGVVVIVWILGVSCGSSHSAVKPPSPPNIFEELDQAATAQSETGQVVLRYNPCICGCPAFELQIGKRWVRAGLEGEDDPESPAAKFAVQARTDHQNGVLSHYRVRGEVNPTPQPCDKGAIYMLVSVESDE